MKILFTLALLTATLFQANAATYLQLSQTNALAAGITNQAKAYTDAVASTNNANWVKDGPTNSTIPGIASGYRFYATNAIGVNTVAPNNYLDVLANADNKGYLLSKDGSTALARTARSTDGAYLTLMHAGTNVVYLNSDTDYGGAQQIYGTLNLGGSQVITNSSTSTTPLTINHASGATAPGILQTTGGTQTFTLGPDGVVTSSGYDDNAPVAVTETGGTQSIDFAALNRRINLSLTGGVIYTYANLSGTAVRRFTVAVKNSQATNCPFTFPAGTCTNGIVGYNTAGKSGTLTFEYNPGWATNVFYIEAQ